MIIDELGASGFAPARLHRLSATLQASVDDAAIPGAAMLVARRGRIAYYESFGFRDREAGAAMPPEAIFRIASMTKPIISLAAMILVEESKLSLGSPIAQFLPELKNLEVGVEMADGSLTRKSPRREITVQDLLRHTSGFTYGWLGRSAAKRLYVASDIANPGHSRAEFIAPSFSSSPWMRGAPHKRLAKLISRISRRISTGTFGRHPESATSSANTVESQSDAIE
jgi:CubicO group peptidase (beta-lactamase class C family)